MKATVLAQMARIIAKIDAYPERTDLFREQSRDELQKYFQEAQKENLI